MSTTNAAEAVEEFKLSNRGNKLIGEENPGTRRPQKYCRLRSTILRENDDESESDFEVKLLGSSIYLLYVFYEEFPKNVY